MPPAVHNSRVANSWATAAMLLPLALLAVVVWRSYATGGLASSLLRGDLPAAEKLALLRTQFGEFGAAAPLIYIAFVTIEVVVAPIPGTMLYAPGGVLFGGFWGGLYATIGNVLGAGLACQLMRSVGERFLSRWLEAGPLARHRDALGERGIGIVFLLRVNPLTSSDLVSYAAGLVGMPVWKVMLGTLLGMSPLCFAQAYLAEGLLDALPWLFYPLLAACAIYAACVLWVLRKLWLEQRAALSRS